MRRRSFLQSLAGGAAARPPSGAAGGVRLGYDSYSIRAFRWKALQHLEYAARWKLDTVQLSSLDDYESLAPAHLGKVKELAGRRGISIDAGIGCVCPASKGYHPRTGDPVAYLARGLAVAKAVGAGSLRCYLGNSQDRQSGNIDAVMESGIKVLRQARPRALDAGVKMAVENHQDLQAHELRAVIEEAGKDAVGACLDAGNPVFTLEDPRATLETLAPYALTTHLRDAVLYEHPRGAAVQWVALGDGQVDIPGWMARFRELCPGTPVQLEIITGRPPTIVPYLEADFWKMYPRTPAREFARFVALVKRGRPFEGRMVVAEGGPAIPEFQAALREQQRLDLERSLQFAAKTLGLGIRARAA